MRHTHSKSQRPMIGNIFPAAVDFGRLKIVSACLSSAKWTRENPIAAILIFASLLLVLFAYLPTLQFDFVSGDEERAFMHSAPSTFASRFDECEGGAVSLYTKSGRPLIWIGECLEHGFVSTISDFEIIRPITLAVVLFATVLLAFVIAPLVGGIACAIPVASLFALAPGYAFMYYRSLSGATTILAIAFAAASCLILTRYQNRSPRFSLASLQDDAIVGALVLFVAACCIYPAYAFVAVTIVWLNFGLTTGLSLSERFKRLASNLFFYVLGSVAYFALARFLILANFFHSRTTELTDKHYELTPVMNVMTMIERAGEALKSMSGEPLLLFNSDRLFLISAATAFSCYAGYQIARQRKSSIAWMAAATIGILIACPIMLAGALTPWIMSPMTDEHPRFFLAAHLFEIVATAGVISAIARLWAIDQIKVAALFVVLLGLAAIDQNRKSFLEVTASATQIDALRTGLEQWQDNGGARNSRWILVVMPNKDQPSFVERAAAEYYTAGTVPEPRYPALMTWANQPAHIFFLAVAILREKNGRSPDHRVELVDCEFNQVCVDNVLRSETDEVAFSGLHQSDISSTPIEVPAQPFVINLSLLTTDPANPSFVVKK